MDKNRMWYTDNKCCISVMQKIFILPPLSKVLGGVTLTPIQFQVHNSIMQFLVEIIVFEWGLALSGLLVSWCCWFAFKDEKSLQELAGQCSMDLHHCLVPVFPWGGCSQYKLLMGGHVQQCVEGNTGDLAPELLTSNSCVNYPPPNESQL